MGELYDILCNLPIRENWVVPPTEPMEIVEKVRSFMASEAMGDFIVELVPPPQSAFTADSFIRKSFWSVRFAREASKSSEATIDLRGGRSNLVLPMTRTDQRQEDPVFSADDARQIARVLLNCPGSLEILFMLFDVGAVSVGALVPAATDDESVMEAVAELRRFGLLSIKGRTVDLAERGRIAVVKLRSQSKTTVERNE